MRRSSASYVGKNVLDVCDPRMTRCFCVIGGGVKRVLGGGGARSSRGSLLPSGAERRDGWHLPHRGVQKILQASADSGVGRGGSVQQVTQRHPSCPC